MAARPSTLSEMDVLPIHLADVQRITGISRNTLRAEIKAGRLACCIIRGRRYLTRAQILAWLKRIEVSARES